MLLGRKRAAPIQPKSNLNLAWCSLSLSRFNLSKSTYYSYNVTSAAGITSAELATAGTEADDADDAADADNAADADTADAAAAAAAGWVNPSVKTHHPVITKLVEKRETLRWDRWDF